MKCDVKKVLISAFLLQSQDPAHAADIVDRECVRQQATNTIQEEYGSQVKTVWDNFDNPRIEVGVSAYLDSSDSIPPPNAITLPDHNKELSVDFLFSSEGEKAELLCSFAKIGIDPYSVDFSGKARFSTEIIAWTSFTDNFQQCSSFKHSSVGGVASFVSKDELGRAGVIQGEAEKFQDRLNLILQNNC